MGIRFLFSRLKPGTSEWEEVMNAEFPKPIIDERTRQIAMYYHGRVRGDARIASGRFYTTEEYEEKRKRILSTPLP